MSYPGRLLLDAKDPDMEDIAIALSRFGAGIFAGTCLYVSAVGQPVRVAGAISTALPHFSASLARSERLQPALHVFALAATILACVLAPAAPRIAGLVVMAPVLPYSVLVVVPLNNSLKTRNLPTRPDEAVANLKRWSTLHGVRTALAVGSFALLCWP